MTSAHMPNQDQPMHEMKKEQWQTPSLICLASLDTEGGATVKPEGLDGLFLS